MENIELPAIFNNIQSCNIKEYSEYLSKALVLIETNPGFIEIIQTILSCKRSGLPPRITYFLKRIFEELSNNSIEILKEILSSLITLSGSKSTRAKSHSLRLIFMILSVNKLDLDGNTLQLIAERLFDKETSVRKEAIKICLMYQDCFISESLKIQHTLKDVIRYDQSNEIRRLGLNGIELNKITYNCVIERCLDVNVNIRKCFWMNIFKKIDLRAIDFCQRIFLLKAGFLEREFDAKTYFMEGIVSFGFDDFIDLFYSNEQVYSEAIKMYLKNSNKKFELNKYTPSYVHFMNIYYNYMENSAGRDSLNLVPIDEFLSILYERCIELEEKIANQNENVQDDIKIATGMFKLLAFYDIFTDDSRKSILSIIKHLLTKSNVKEIVEEAVILSKKVCSNDLIPFLGSIVKKTKGTPLCMIVCEYIMKHIPYESMHDAIIQEIVILDLSNSLNILYWANVQKPQESIINLYLNFLPNKKAIDGCTDLVLMNIIDFERIEPCISSQIQKFSENCVIPVSKLLLAKKISENFYLKFLLEIFYTSTTEYILQYLSLFFYEFITNDSSPIIEVYCDVLEKITQNQKTFVDQALYWISNSKSQGGSQKLFLNVSLYIYNNYDTLKNKKFLFQTLEKISILPCWNKVLTKKIIYLVSMIVKKRPRENVQLLLTNLMEIDDGEPLDPEEFKALKSLVKNE